MPGKQEQELATTDIVEVAPAVRRMQLPINFTGLGHVNCYAIEDDRGFALVDPGLPGDESWADLIHRLQLAEVPLGRVHTVVVTHSHPDHFGGAARLAAETGADILTHRSFRMWWHTDDDLEALNDLGADDVVTADQLLAPPDDHRRTPWGTEFVPPNDAAVSKMRADLRSKQHTPRPTIRVDDAQPVKLGGREWVALHTPGHTFDHLCLYDPEHGVLLSGDHVLPTITPHVGDMVGRADDPLAAFFSSLERVAALPSISTVLPAHGHPFTDLAGRVADIEQHHERRLQRLRDAATALGDGAPVAEWMRHLFSERAWGGMAESETFAHLEHLRHAGEATTQWRDGLLHYRLGSR
jgi:glyoxylase-like metal-dependent hydrolase (beta-lactamase superfamily II)